MGGPSVGVSTYHLASGAFWAPFLGYASYYRRNSAIRIAVIYLCFHKHLHRKTITHLFSETSLDIPIGRPLFSATFWLRMGQKKESLFFRMFPAGLRSRSVARKRFPFAWLARSRTTVTSRHLWKGLKRMPKKTRTCHSERREGSAWVGPHLHS